MDVVNKMCPGAEIDVEALRQLLTYEQPVTYAWVDASGVIYSFVVPIVEDHEWVLSKGTSKGGYGISWFQYNPREFRECHERFPKQTCCPTLSGLQPKGHSRGKGLALPASPAGSRLPLGKGKGKGSAWKGKVFGPVDGKGKSPKRAHAAGNPKTKKKKQTKESEEACSWSMGSSSDHGALSGDASSSD